MGGKAAKARYFDENTNFTQIKHETGLSSKYNNGFYPRQYFAGATVSQLPLKPEEGFSKRAPAKGVFKTRHFRSGTIDNSRSVSTDNDDNNSPYERYRAMCLYCVHS